MDVIGLASRLVTEGYELCFPRVCTGCGRFGAEVCEACRSWLFRGPVRFSGQRVGLRSQLSVWGLAPYTQPARGVVLAGKNGQSREVRQVLVQAGLVAGARLIKPADGELARPDAVVVLPSHRREGRRLLEVSAGCFAAGVAQGANLQLCELLRLREGAQKQAGRSAVERFNHRLDAFEIVRQPADVLIACYPVGYRPRLWLIDDVVTTGATIYHACNLLEQFGFEVVGVVAICIVNQS